jgi:type II secretory pathway pseudopilin PulG
MSVPTPNPIRLRRAFSLVEVVVAVGIFAVAVLSIIGLLLPNTQAVEDQIESDAARRLTENVQSELQRYLRAISEDQKGGANKGEGLRNFDNLFYSGGGTRSIFLVGTRDGSRVLVTGEDPYLAWNDTYKNPYDPRVVGNYTTVGSPLVAENNLITDSTSESPAGIAFRDRYYLIEVFLPETPKHRKTDVPSNVALPFLPLGVRVVWPYRIPNGPANATDTSKYNTYNDLPWLVVSPAKHSVFNFNLALAP